MFTEKNKTFLDHHDTNKRLDEVQRYIHTYIYIYNIYSPVRDTRAHSKL